MPVAFAKTISPRYFNLLHGSVKYLILIGHSIGYFSITIAKNR